MEGEITKNKHTFWRQAIFGVFSLCCLFVISGISPAKATVNKQINYQGRLSDSSGSPVADGDYDMVFKIYNTIAEGTPLWTGNYNTSNFNPVTVNRGLFSIMLGSGAGNSINLNFADEDTYYLEISIKYDTEYEALSPRRVIGAVPQAFNANNLIGNGRINLSSLPAGLAVSDGPVYINPTTNGGSNSNTLLGVAVNDVEKMRLDAYGNLSISGMIISNGSSLTLYDDASLDQDLMVSSSPTFAGLTINTLTGLLKAGNGVVATAIAGTDFVTPSGAEALSNKTMTGLSLSAGTNSLPPIKFATGTNLSNPEAGAMEFDGTSLYFTPNSSRKTLAFTDSSISGTSANVTGTVAIGNGGTGSTNGSITGSGALTFAAGGASNNINLTPSGSGIVSISGGLSVAGYNLTVTGTSAINQDVRTSAAPTFAGLTVGSGTGLLKATNGVIGTAVAGTDYVTPSGTTTLSNKTMTGLLLTAGTATVAPIKIAAGTNLSVPQTGAIEFDGTRLTYTDNLATPVRQTLIPADYGEIYEDAAGSTLNIPLAGTWYGWKTANAGSTKLITADVSNATADNLTIASGGDGVYRVNFIVSCADDAGDTMKWAVFKNGVRQGNIAGQFTYKNVSTAANVTGSGLLTLVTGDVIDIRVTSLKNNNTLTLHAVNLSMQRVSK